MNLLKSLLHHAGRCRAGSVAEPCPVKSSAGGLLNGWLLVECDWGRPGKYQVRPALALEQHARHIDVQRVQKCRQLPVEFDAYL